MSKTVAVDIERTPRRPHRETLSPDINVLGFPFFLVACIASVYSAQGLLSESEGLGAFPLTYFSIHIVAAVCTGLGVYIALGKHEESRLGWGLFTGIFAFLGGPVGVLGGILCYLLARGHPKEMPLTEVVKAEMFVTAIDEEDEDLTSLDLRIQEESQVEPFVDMIPLADIPTAIAIINRLKERGEKSDIEMIREISNDPRPEVYQYALAILDKMEKEFAGEVYALSQEIKGRPDASQARVDLAKLHIDYIHSGLLDESLADYYWELTLSHLFEAMLSNPDKMELGADFAQLLAQKGMVDDASLVAERILKAQPTMMQAQLLVLRSLFEKAVGGDQEALVSAHKRALENAWAVDLPRKRTAGLGPSYDLAHFWFGEESSD